MSSNSNEYQVPIKHYKCGEVWSSSHRGPNAATPNAKSPLRVFSFNIERGYHWKAIVQMLKAANADIVLLQEVDMYCERTGKTMATHDASALIASLRCRQREHCRRDGA
jgi:endonuclease/exonuclease/phosphatase family metal-dependent hydrolase